MRISRALRYIWRPLAVVFGVYAVCVTGFILTQKVSVYIGIYWGVITMSTVGYGDVVPTNNLSRLFAIILAASTIGILGYVVSTISTLTLKAREEEEFGLDGTTFKDHTLVLGWTPVARAALQELLLSGRRVAIMTRKQESLSEIRTYVSSLLQDARRNKETASRVSSESDVFIALGDYSERSSLALVNVQRAREAIVASDDDARNVMTALILKELAPHLRIVVAVLREQLRDTLVAAGVTYVVSPSDLGGRMISSAAWQPEVAAAVNDVTTVSYGSTIDEFAVTERNPLRGLTFEEALPRLRKATGGLLIGIAYPPSAQSASDRDKFKVVLSPSPSTRLDPGTYILVLSSLGDVEKVRDWIGVPPGRPRNN